jgi:predicted alpha/beta-hydrolase family hydrolase
VKGAVLLAPGASGSAEQPILRKMAALLEARGFATKRISFTSKRASRGYVKEMEDLRRERDALRAAHPGPFTLVGRSFGGRMCAFLAEREPPDALVILGHPISPPGRPRPADEATLAALLCPTLVVQGDRDALGPLEVVLRAAAHNPRVDIVTLDATGHTFGPKEDEALQHAARWLKSTLAP